MDHLGCGPFVEAALQVLRAMVLATPHTGREWRALWLRIGLPDVACAAAEEHQSTRTTAHSLVALTLFSGQWQALVD